MNDPHPSDSSIPTNASPKPATQRRPVGLWFFIALLIIAIGFSFGLVWRTSQRVELLERELVSRQQTSNEQATQAQVLAKQSQDLSRDTAAKVSLLDAKFSEASAQRAQVEQLLLSMSTSRDENVVSDIESNVRLGMLQAGATGSIEPLLLVLRQSDERLARYNQPRLDPLRQALARDLDQIKSHRANDPVVTAQKLDESIRKIDQLPLLSTPHSREIKRFDAPSVGTSSATTGVDSISLSLRNFQFQEGASWQRLINAVFQEVWSEIKDLIRVSRIDHPEGMLLAPEQAFFVKENIKLRLLNARLALLSRQFDTAQVDLQDVQNSLTRYFQVQAPQTQAFQQTLLWVLTQTKPLPEPRPEATLSVLSSMTISR
jgi:uroporphyrin-III C-methyltransferase